MFWQGNTTHSCTIESWIRNRRLYKSWLSARRRWCWWYWHSAILAWTQSIFSNVVIDSTANLFHTSHQHYDRKFVLSLSRNTVSEWRTNLDQEKLDRLMFLQKNLPLLKQLEDIDAKMLQVEGLISISTKTSIERQSGHTIDGLLSTCTTKPKKQWSENEREIILLDHENGSHFNDVKDTSIFFNLHSLFAHVK